MLTNHNIQCSLLQANQKQCNPDDYKIDIENIVLGEILKKSDMMNVGIYTLEGETMYSSTNVYFNKKNVLKELWYQKVQNTLGEMIWIDTYKDNLNHDVISASRKIYALTSEIYTVGECIGYLLMSYNEQFLENIYGDYYTQEDHKFYIINDQGVIVSHKDKQLLNTCLPKDIFIYNIYVLLISCFIVILIALRFSSRLSKPLIHLQSEMKKVEKGDFSVSINTNGKDEVAELGKSFVKMVKRLQTLIQEMYNIQNSKHQAELKQKEAEMAALQAQINPHFLYNTLETIRMVALVNQDRKAATMIKLLSNLFRYNIKKGSNMVCVREELEHVKTYLQLQKLRFNDKFDVILEFDEEILDYKIVKLILQPIVENAIYHGIEPKEEKGILFIRGYQENKLIKFVVEDNGVGIEKEKLDKIQSHLLYTELDGEKRSIGLNNISDRIRLYFNIEEGVQIESKKGVGTKVILSMRISDNHSDIDKIGEIKEC